MSVILDQSLFQMHICKYKLRNLKAECWFYVGFVQSNLLLTKSCIYTVYSPFNGITPVLSNFLILVPVNCFQIIENKNYIKV